MGAKLTGAGNAFLFLRSAPHLAKVKSILQAVINARGRPLVVIVIAAAPVAFAVWHYPGFKFHAIARLTIQFFHLLAHAEPQMIRDRRPRLIVHIRQEAGPGKVVKKPPAQSDQPSRRTSLACPIALVGPSRMPGLPSAILLAMAGEKGLWLIGVRRKEMTAAGVPYFLSDLQHRFSSGELKREGIASLIRDVPVPEEIFVLQKKHGREFIGFYYVDEALVKAATAAGIKLNRLQLVFGDPAAAEVQTLIYLPPEYE
jgi:hypothetical protein